MLYHTGWHIVCIHLCMRILCVLLHVSLCRLSVCVCVSVCMLYCVSHLDFSVNAAQLQRTLGHRAQLGREMKHSWG